MISFTQLFTLHCDNTDKTFSENLALRLADSCGSRINDFRKKIQTDGVQRF